MSIPPLAPWILLERTTVDQTATVLERLEAWLLGSELDPATDSRARPLPR